MKTKILLIDGFYTAWYQKIQPWGRWRRIKSGFNHHFTKQDAANEIIRFMVKEGIIPIECEGGLQPSPEIKDGKCHTATFGMYINKS